MAQDGAYAPDAVAKKRAVISKMVEKFFSGEALYPFIPIMGTVCNKVLPSRAQELYAGLTQCRASTHLLNVMPDGKIYPCPDLMYLPEMLQGDVVGNWLKPSPLQPHPDMPCERCGATLIFAPAAEEIYPRGYSTFVTEEMLSKPLCGQSRPAHMIKRYLAHSAAVFIYHYHILF